MLDFFILFFSETVKDFPFPAFSEVQALASLQMLSIVDTLIDVVRTSLWLTAPHSPQPKQTSIDSKKTD